MDPKSHPAPAGQLVYEDVEPQYQWVPGKDADTLVVDLTGFKGEAGFKREHLKVKIDYQGNLKVSGERPLSGDGGNRWRRFQKVYRVAEDCNTGEISAKFNNGVLSVVMPKRIKDHPSSPPAAAAVGQPPAAAQTPSATPSATYPIPPVKPEPKAAPEEGKGQAAAPADYGKRDAARDKKEAEPAAERPAPPLVRRPSSPPPAVVGEGPRCGMGTWRRPRWVAVGVAVVAVVVVVVGLGFYYWSHRNGVTPDEHQQQMEGFDEY